MNHSTMRASVLKDVRKIELQDVPAPTVGAGDVLLQVAAVGVCGTDFHIYSGEANYNRDERDQPIPLTRQGQILGHEITGVVQDVGPGVTDLKPGQRVVVDQGRNCHSDRRATPCEYCESGNSHQCEWYEEYGLTGLPGGFAEQMAVPAVNAVALHSDLSAEEAALTEPLGCVLHSSARVRQSRRRYGFPGEGCTHPIQSVMILGAGPAGLLFLQVLRQVVRFEGRILVSEPEPGKRKLAAKLGAEVLDPSRQDVAAEVLERTSGRRVEYLIEATGAAFGEIPGLIRKQGTVLQYGVGHGGASLELLNEVQWREPTLVLSVGASGGFDRTGRPTIYREALELLERGTIQARPLLTHLYQGLEQIPRAFEGDHQKPGYVKGVVLLPSQ